MSLERRTYSCGWWNITGLPCKHAARAIGFVRGNIEEYYDDYYNIAYYLRVYVGTLHLVPQKDIKPDVEYPSMLPPPLRRQPGRPRKVRRRDESEPLAKSMRSIAVTCARCNQTGHNRRTCQYAPFRGNRAIRQRKKKQTTAQPHP
ncbi:uncharacterized protein LOC131182921 [Hevea brasiliensis]|uniref:uncharacterized protein LOC131182921 n=1 Tax=Hevea brasiliensis TaxID=3981 RepID=UPI0025D87A13|nr:uncharacterized protein LOC131182921 [Hevea brasiliensis]